jgi:hypothetical protein
MASRKDNNKQNMNGALSPAPAKVYRPYSFLSCTLRFVILVIASASIAAGGIVFFAPQPSSINHLQDEVQRLTKTILPFKHQIETLQQQQRSSASPVSHENALTDTEQSSPSNAFLSLVEKLEERLGRLEQSLKKQHSQTLQRPQRVERYYIHLQALERLKDALKTSHPFQKELSAVLSAITPARQEDESIFKTFAEIAIIGAPTVSALEKAFHTEVLPALQPTPSTWFERWRQYVVSKIDTLVVISNESSTVSSAQPWLTTVQEALKYGHLDKALFVLDHTSNPLHSALLSWKKDAERRLFVEKNALFIKAYALEAMLYPNTSEDSQNNSSAAENEDKKS